MKKLYKTTLLLLFSILLLSAKADDGNKSWNIKFDKQKSFIENKGQFYINGKTENHSKVMFAIDNGATKVYFTAQGLTFSFLKRWKNEDKDEEKEALKKGKSHADIEAEEKRMNFATDVIDMLWEGANPDAKLIAEDITPDYQSYSVPQKNAQPINITNINCYKRLTYQNIYPNIDIEYTFHPETGIKYAIILHPGADIAAVKMKYTNDVKINLKGDVLVNTKFGNIVDHCPLTFYEGNKTAVITSKFIRKGKTISLELGNYDKTKTVIVDPWVQTPTLPASNGVWECERDGAGNVYIIGGETPLQLLKYNAAGALQWTYVTPWDTSNQDWLGTLATDLAGNSYITNGSAAAMQKISTAGSMIWSLTGGAFDEYWTIAFNCDQTKLIVGGTRITGLPLPIGDGMIFDINTATGGVTATKVVGHDRTGFLGINDIEEVRSITSSYNARYYFMTLDSLGSFDQNFAACPSSSTMFNINDTYHFGYKMENYRPNNGNSGICAIKANKNFVYTQNGTTVQKRSLTTGAVITSVAIPGGASVTTLGENQTANSGIDIDSCGNVYVGSSNAVIKYDANLVQLSSVAVPFKVYDVAVSTNGNVIACGATGDNSVNVRTGYVQQIAMGACIPQVLVCCDANICSIPTVCVTAAPFNLTAVTAGGTWSGTGITNGALGTFSPAIAGVGTFTITYTLTCGTGQLQIIVSPCTVVTLGACADANGDITASNGTAPYTWYNSTTTTSCVPGLGFCSGPFTVAGPPVTTWTSFATGTTVTPAGAYPFWVVDAVGDSLQITSFASLAPCVACPTLTASITAQVNILCFGASTGSFNASTSGGVSPYNYTLLNGGTTIATFTNIAGTQAFVGLPAGTYTLNITDANGCPGTATVTITQPTAALAVAITASANPSCGGTNGSATALASGGTSPYNYVWTGSGGTLQTTNNSTTANTLSGLTSGTYTITVTDNNGCVTSTTVTLTNSGGPTITLSGQVNVLCFGGTAGSITATATLGTSPYNYVWTGSGGTLQTTNNSTVPNTLSNLSAGTYTITVTDNSTCTSTATVTITQPTTAPSVIITASTNAPCGTNTGSATAQASGGTSPYNYVWTSAGGGTLQTTNTITGPNTLSNIGAGTYTITITDANGCTASTTAIISNSGGATVNITSQTNVLCFGGNTGTATATATGGASPYDYVWAGSSGTLQTANNITVPNTLSGLTAGTYTVTVTDSNNCTSNVIFTIIQPTSALAVTLVNSTNATCGNNNGTASVNATGGTIGGGYTYHWLPTGGNNASANGLAANTYTVTATDGNGCTATLNVVISNSTGPTVNITSHTNVNCFGGNTGSATATATGTGTLTYSWTGGGGTNATATNLIAGTYTVTVTDGTGCTNTATVTITQGAVMSVTTNSIASNCSVNSGTASAVANGGTGSYTYSWSAPGGTTSTINNLAPGTYTVTVTDSLGCIQTGSTTVASIGGPTANAGVDVTITSGNSTVLNGTGTSGGTFSWSPASSLSCSNCASPVATPTVTTVYTLTVILNGCTATDTVTVFVDILCGELYVPTAFSPNGDSKNDVLFVFGDCITNLEFAIFDRWGEKVFETTDQTIGWDGTYNGKKMDAGVFAYYLNATVKGEAISKHGNITLVK